MIVMCFSHYVHDHHRGFGIIILNMVIIVMTIIIRMIITYGYCV